MKKFAQDGAVLPDHWSDRYGPALRWLRGHNSIHDLSHRYRCPRTGCDKFHSHEWVKSGQRMLLTDVAECSFEDRMQYVQQLCGRELSSGHGQLESSRRWIDLIYPRHILGDIPAKCGAMPSLGVRGWMDESHTEHPDKNHLMPFRCVQEKQRTRLNVDRGVGGRNQSLENCPQTFLVAETGEWKKRQLSCLCRHKDCSGVSQQRGTAYMLARVQRMSTGVQRFWHIGDLVELKMGVQSTSTKNGFHLASSASAALQLRPRSHGQGKENDMTVLRGCVTGLGCRRGNYLWCSNFRPVCAVDYVVTRFQ